MFNIIKIIIREYFALFKKLIKLSKLKQRSKNSLIRIPTELSYNDIENIIISNKVLIDKHSVIRILNDCKLTIEENTYVGPFCHISGTMNHIKIGKNVLISDRVFISTTNHNYENVNIPPNKQGFSSKGDIIINDECLIGIGVSILSGTQIGEHSIIGANSVVTSNIPPFSVAAGNPAKVIKYYDFKLGKWINK
jgi:acetyltransferase-like isoleucine patch superfamily enzyme